MFNFESRRSLMRAMQLISIYSSRRRRRRFQRDESVRSLLLDIWLSAASIYLSFSLRISDASAAIAAVATAALRNRIDKRADLTRAYIYTLKFYTNDGFR